MKFSEACQIYFGSEDLYEILRIPKQSSAKEVKKAYHKLSLSCHPDRVDEKNKAEATEKFKVLSKVHLILSDPEKRSIYDETGSWMEEVDETDFEAKDWMGYWRNLFNKITFDDLNKYEKEYKGSEDELRDLTDAYIKCKGDMGKVYQHIMFARLDDEDRFRNILTKMIENGEIPKFDAFLNEPQAKRDRRMRKLKKEAKEAEKESANLNGNARNGTDSLRQAIMARQRSEDKFLEALERKYSGSKMSGKTQKKTSRGKGKK